VETPSGHQGDGNSALSSDLGWISFLQVLSIGTVAYVFWSTVKLLHFVLLMSSWCALGFFLVYLDDCKILIL